MSISRAKGLISTLNGGEWSTPRPDLLYLRSNISLHIFPVLLYWTQLHGEFTRKFTFCIVDDGLSHWPRGLRRGPEAALLQGIRVRIPPGNGCFSLESVMFCRVESWPLVQRSLTECGVYECYQEASAMRKPWTTRGLCHGGRGIMLMKIQALLNTGLFTSPSGISELDCATTKTDTAERSISIGRESLQVFLY